MAQTKITSNILATNAAQDNLNAGSSITLTKPITLSGVSVASLSASGNISASGTVTGTNLVYTTTNQSIDGDKTFLQNIVGNGTNNRLPNQTANTPESIITKELLASQFLYHNHVQIFPALWANATVAISGAGANNSTYTDQLRLDGTTSTSLSGAITLKSSATPNFGLIDPSNPASVASFYGPLMFKIRLYHTYNNNYDRDNQSWCVCFGAHSTEPTANITTLMPSPQSNASRGYVALFCDRGAIKLVTQKGTGNSVTSATMETLAATTYFDRQYTLYVNAGTAYLYSDTTLLGSVSGAPIAGVTSGGSPYIFANHTSYTPTPSQQRRLIISRIDTFWGSSATI